MMLHVQDPGEHPEIASFLELARDTAKDRPLSLDDVQSKPFMPYWQYLIIYRHEPDLQDFRVSFFGTEIVASYNEDWTGSLLSESGFELGFESIYEENLSIMVSGELRSAMGDLDWQERAYKKWCQVKMPLSRSGLVSDVLVIMCFL